MEWIKLFSATALIAVFYCILMRYFYRASSFKEVRKWSVIRVIVLPLLILAKSNPWSEVFGGAAAAMLAELISWIYWKRLQGKEGGCDAK
jgi:hypothetical protein